MSASIVAIIGLILFSLAYIFYAKILSTKIFSLHTKKDAPPSINQRDDIDYTPTKKEILVGHHFSSIAGAAPIVGPAVAAIWGWLPAVLWIIFGVIFIGACHDFGTLVVSMENRGKSIAAVAENLFGSKIKNLFFIVIFFLVWMVIAVFALIIANLFIKFPASVIPVNFEILIALVMGFFINKKGKSLKLPSIMAQACLFLMIYLGTLYPVSLNDIFGSHELMAWMVFLLIYSFIASTLPVWALLQPRDYINSHQLFLGLGLMTIGLFITSPEIVAPATNFSAKGAPPWFPFIFITIACGAISGFHGLVSSGTTSKQVAKWSDAKPIGYGSMLGEGFLALLATLAVTTGFASTEAWHHHYIDWSSANGLSAKITAFVLGAGKFVSGVGISPKISQTVIAVLIISFAATSLDTACRIQRYIIAEVGAGLKIKPLENRYISAFIAVMSAFLLMLTSEGGKGGLSLWPLFGATNQMLAGLSLVVVSIFIYTKKKSFKFTLPFLLPAILVMAITSIALYQNMKIYLINQKYFLFLIGIILFVTQLTIIYQSIMKFKQKKAID